MVAALSQSSAAPVVTLAELDRREVVALLARCGARLVELEAHQTIPGSYWGDSEAGLIGDAVYARADTPAHSLLHELCHQLDYELLGLPDSFHARGARDHEARAMRTCGIFARSAFR